MTKIRHILENEIYIGPLYYQKIRVEWGKRIPQPKEKWIRIDVPDLAVIDEETFKAAQESTEELGES